MIYLSQVISLDTYIQMATLIVATATFIIAQAIQRNRDRDVARRGIYEKLELSSIELFRFEADHIDLIRPVWEKEAKLPVKGTAEYIATLNYVCQILNLFELAIKFRKDQTMPADVFGSWVAWFLLLAKAPGFKPIWQDAGANYIQELRQIIDGGLYLIETEHDPVLQEKKFYGFISHFLKVDVDIAEIKDTDSTPVANYLATHAQKGRNKPSSESTSLDIHWESDPAQASVFAQFFMANTASHYISHGELQGGRASSPDTWAPDLAARLTAEFTHALTHPPFHTSNLIGAYDQGTLIGFIFLEYDNSPDGIYAIMSDIVVDKKYRNHHVGETLLTWCSQQLAEAQIHDLYAESNISNLAAHAFLEKTGFRILSKVFRKQIME